VILNVRKWREIYENQYEPCRRTSEDYAGRDLPVKAAGSHCEKSFWNFPEPTERFHTDTRFYQFPRQYGILSYGKERTTFL